MKAFDHSVLLAQCWGLAIVAAAASPAVVEAQAASTIAELTAVEVQQTGNPPTGRFAVVVEHDPGLATHTIYRPRELSLDEHPVLVWGEGGCAKNGLMFPEYLSEIASHGFVVIADGPPIARPAGGPAAGGGGPPADRFTMVDGTALIAALDWLEAQSKSRASRFYGRVNVERVAAMGMSCGGLMSYGASSDPRVATVGIWNSGLFEDERNAGVYAGIHGSVIIVTGGESDIAYANGKRDFEVMPARIPTFYGVYPAVGHGGTYNQDNGGPFGVVAVAWLKWQLLGDTSAAGRGYFVGQSCGICKDAAWQTGARALP